MLRLRPIISGETCPASPSVVLPPELVTDNDDEEGPCKRRSKFGCAGAVAEDADAGVLDEARTCEATCSVAFWFVFLDFLDDMFLTHIHINIGSMIAGACGAQLTDSQDNR